MAKAALKVLRRERPSTSAPTGPQIFVRDYTDVHITPPEAIVYPRVVEYTSSRFAKRTKHEEQRGLRVSLYQATESTFATEGAAVAARGIASRDLQYPVPGLCDVYAYSGSPEGRDANRLELEGWRAPVAEVEEFANALLAMIAKGRAEGMFE